MSKWAKITASSLLLVLSIHPPAFAESEASVKIPVSQTVSIKASDTAGVNQTYSYTLTEMTANSPMPEGSVSGVYSFSITGTANIEIPSIQYEEDGTYQYEVSCITKAPNSYYTVDTSRYKVSVFIGHDDADAATSTVVAQKDGEQVKSDQIQYLHGYQKEDVSLISLKTDTGLLNENIDFGTYTAGYTNVSIKEITVSNIGNVDVDVVNPESTEHFL